MDDLDRRCDTCAKANHSYTQCKVLKEMIGLDGPCWAWTDELNWEWKVRQAVKDYVEKGGGTK